MVSLSWLLFFWVVTATIRETPGFPARVGLVIHIVLEVLMGLILIGVWR